LPSKEEGVKAMAAEVTIRWFGHACFLIRSSDGTKVLTDPFDESVGYPLPDTDADVITVSHDHFDHSHTASVKRNPTVVTGAGEHHASGMTFLGIVTAHDETGGSKRGRNTVFVWDMEEIRFCHLGDLGHVLTPAQVAAIGTPDVLFVPVGGTYTVDAAEATEVVDQLAPRIAFPMHYRTSVMGPDFPIAEVGPFMRGKRDAERIQGSAVALTKEALPTGTKIIVLGWG